MLTQQRHIKNARLIKLPQAIVEQDRGLDECCDLPLVLANGSSKTYENDVLGAWIKLSDVSDTCTFVLKKQGNVNATYQPIINAFPSELNAFFVQIEWKDVLASDGVGCYKLEINYNISGISGTIIWGAYNLQTFTVERAKTTIRVRAIINDFNEELGLNFKGANINTSIRFNGYIGDLQPNMKITNNVYNNRQLQVVKRENIKSWQLSSDGLKNDIIKQLIDVYFLAGIELYVSDYNIFNPDYSINDIFVSFEESPELEHIQFSRLVKFKVKLIDALQNKRNYYK